MIIDAETAKHIEDLKSSLEAEWALKEEATADKKERRERHREEREESNKEAALAKLRQQYTEQFWTERGYVLHIDSRGHKEWMSKEQHERRLRRRNRSQRKAKKELYKRFGYGLGITLFCALLGYILANV